MTIKRNDKNWPDRKPQISVQNQLCNYIWSIVQPDLFVRPSRSNSEDNWWDIWIHLKRSNTVRVHGGRARYRSRFVDWWRGGTAKAFYRAKVFARLSVSISVSTRLIRNIDLSDHLGIGVKGVRLKKEEAIRCSGYLKNGRESELSNISLKKKCSDFLRQSLSIARHAREELLTGKRKGGDIRESQISEMQNSVGREKIIVDC